MNASASRLVAEQKYSFSFCFSSASSNSAAVSISAFSRRWQYSIASQHQFAAALNSCFSLMVSVLFNTMLNLVDPGVLSDDGCRETARVLISSISLQCLVYRWNILSPISWIGFGSNARNWKVAFFEISFGLVITAGWFANEVFFRLVLPSVGLQTSCCCCCCCCCCCNIYGRVGSLTRLS